MAKSSPQALQPTTIGSPLTRVIGLRPIMRIYRRADRSILRAWHRPENSLTGTAKHWKAILAIFRSMKLFTRMLHGLKWMRLTRVVSWTSRALRMDDIFSSSLSRSPYCSWKRCEPRLISLTSVSAPSTLRADGSRSFIRRKPRT